MYVWLSLPIPLQRQVSLHLAVRQTTTTGMNCWMAKGVLPRLSIPTYRLFNREELVGEVKVDEIAFQGMYACVCMYVWKFMHVCMS